MSPKHRLIKVDSQEFGRCKVPLSPVTVQEEPVSIVISDNHNLKTLRSSVIAFHLCNSLCFYPPTKVVPSAPAASEADTDYSDPFDAHPHPRARTNWEPKSAPADCCSYMEPFEAQRIISGLLYIKVATCIW